MWGGHIPWTHQWSSVNIDRNVYMITIKCQSLHQMCDNSSQWYKLPSIHLQVILWRHPWFLTEDMEFPFIHLGRVQHVYAWMVVVVGKSTAISVFLGVGWLCFALIHWNWFQTTNYISLLYAKNIPIIFSVVCQPLFIYLMEKWLTLAWFLRHPQIKLFHTHLRYWCNSIVAFTTNWKFWFCCIHSLLGVSIYSKLILFQIHVSHFCWLEVQVMNTRLVMMSVNLCTQTGLHCLIIQVLHTRVWFLNIWYTSLTSIHSNLEHGLAILTERFTPLRSVLHNLPC